MIRSGLEGVAHPHMTAETLPLAFSVFNSINSKITSEAQASLTVSRRPCFVADATNNNERVLFLTILKNNGCHVAAAGGRSTVITSSRSHLWRRGAFHPGDGGGGAVDGRGRATGDHDTSANAPRSLARGIANRTEASAGCGAAQRDRTAANRRDGGAPQAKAETKAQRRTGTSERCATKCAYGRTSGVGR